MKKAILSSVITAALALTSVNAFASDNTKAAVGGQLDVGAPDGAALGLLLEAPRLHFLTFGVSGTYNALAPGLRGEVVLHPTWAIKPEVAVDLGHSFQGKVPNVSNSPSIGYTYVNFQPGIAFGKTFQFFIRGGMSYISADVSGFSNSLNLKGVSVGDPSFSGWIPSAKLGFSLLF